MTSPAPTGEERTLEQRVAARIEECQFWSSTSTPTDAAAQVIALVRESIARDIEAENNGRHYALTFRNGMDLAAAIARGGVS